jgi:hypothetical protein
MGNRYSVIEWKTDVSNLELSSLIEITVVPITKNLLRDIQRLNANGVLEVIVIISTDELNGQKLRGAMCIESPLYFSLTAS